MSIKIGSNDISKIYLGSTEIEKIYQGSTVIYSGGSEPTPPSYDTQYLTFRALESGTFKFSGTTPTTANTLQYSVDSGATWNTLAFNTDSPTVQSGGTIMWKASGLATDTNNGTLKFISTGRFEAEGNVMSLISGDTFTSATTIPSNNYFHWLFNGCSGLTSAENMVLPATTLAVGCYSQMFQGCTSLTTPPQLPATTLANSCYSYMFNGCTSLATAPELPATTLADWCYSGMFQGCTNLTTAPQLPATTLTNSCYQNMFYACTSLTTAPELPATTLADYCYYSMFENCSSLTTAPQLPATTLAECCYQGMFENCSSLTTAPQLPATTLADYCYYSMFDSCTSLNSITCLATDISAVDCTTSWVNGVASTGTFTSAVGMADWRCGKNGIPTDWTVVGGEPCQGGGDVVVELNADVDLNQWCGVELPQYLINFDRMINGSLYFNDNDSDACDGSFYMGQEVDMRFSSPPIDLDNYRYLCALQPNFFDYPNTLYFSDDPDA